MALNLVAMAMAIVVGDAIANELSVATETRRDYTVHSHDKKVKIHLLPQVHQETLHLLIFTAFQKEGMPCMGKPRLFCFCEMHTFKEMK